MWFFFFFFFFGGGEGGKGSVGLGVMIFGGEVLGPGFGRGVGSRRVGIFVGRGNWVGVWVEGRSLGWGCFGG